MHLTLKLHPDSRAAAVSRIDVEIWRPKARGLVLRFTAYGKMGDVLWPRHAGWCRADELWRHTCFEAFIRPKAGESYSEFNFSPSMQWAAYRFDAYRSGMRNETEFSDPVVEVNYSADFYEMRAFIRTGVSRSALLLGLSAVIEEKAGQKSYWSLAHAPGKPDFHHAESFAYELPAVDNSEESA